MGGVGGSDLRVALEALERAWQDGGDSATSELAGPGLDPSHIRAAVADLPLTMHADAVTWFGWHTSRQVSGPRIGGAVMNFIDLEHALELYDFYTGIAQEFAADLGSSMAEAGWDPSWFPLAQTDGGDTLALDCSAAPDGPAPLRIRHHILLGTESIVVDSLLTLVRDWTESYRNGAYTWNGTRWAEDVDHIPTWRQYSALW
jgi:cell wall assembly regulator SMI1